MVLIARWRVYINGNRLLKDVQDVILHFELENSNNVVSMAITRTQIAKELLFQ